MLLSGMEIIDYANALKPSVSYPNIFSVAEMKPFDSIPVNFEEYQAILPIPYYNVGAEDGNITLDDIDDWSAYTYQLCYKSKLPLMSSKLSRTPPEFAEKMLGIFINDSIPSDIRRLMNGKPVLVAYHKYWINDSSALQRLVSDNDTISRGYVFRSLNLSRDFPRRLDMEKIYEQDNICYYRWVIK